MTPIDVVDILVVAYIIYRVMKLLKDTSAARLAKGILILVLIMLFASFLRLTMISWLLRNALSVGVFAVVVIFQPELRRLLERMGSKALPRFGAKPLETLGMDNVISQTIAACTQLSATKTGALIVFERSVTLDEQMRSGTIINSDVTAELLKNIFYPKAPLHDGAVVIRDGRIAAAGCVLPLTSNTNLSPDLGTRHRAGIGTSEVSDAVVVIVSEETGTISVAIGGMLKRHLAPQTLEKLLSNELMTNDDAKRSLLDRLRARIAKAGNYEKK